MKYLFSEWGSIRKSLRGKFVYLFLDYDGTLAPIAQMPSRAIISKDTKDLLRQLSKTPHCKIAIVSGRALRDVSRRVGLKNLVYVGNHGIEIKGPKIRFKSFCQPRYKVVQERIKKKLAKGLSVINGVIIEDKGSSLSVHYRLVDKKYIQEVRDIFYAAIALGRVRNNIRTNIGKMVLEIMPSIDWDKGKAVSWLLAQQKPVLAKIEQKILPIYVGDDTTDEDAFKVLRKDGITVSVGKTEKSQACYYIRRIKEVRRLLKLILKEKAAI